MNNLCHEVERFDNLMYEGCEPHWHCIHCDDFWPFHCYGKKDLEQIVCKARKHIQPLTGMTADVVISLRPEWWHKITIGRKNVEIRKSFPTRLMRMDIPEKNGFTAAVHVSGTPDISGFIHFYEITTNKTRMITGSGMTAEEFDEYSNGLTVFGWCLDSVQKLKKQIPLEEFGIKKPPQSWVYVKAAPKQLAAFADRDTAAYADRGTLMPAT